MSFYKWMMLAVSGFAPALAYADAPATRPSSPESFHIVVQMEPADGPRKILVREVDDENPAPKLGERPINLGQPRTFELVGGFEAKREKGAYLGVSATPPPPVLRKQLGLSPGMGLVIDFIAPDSPAAKAGLKEFDVLQKLDDQLIVNQEQLAVLVRSHKPGDEIKLSVIHDSKPATLSAKLGEHDLEPLGRQGMEFNIVNDALRQMLPEPHVHPIQPNDRAMKLWIEKARQSGPSSYTLIDGEHSYSVTTDAAGHKTLVARDKDGKETFNGLVDTPEQREKLLGDLKTELEKIEKLNPKLGGGFSTPQGKTEPAQKKPEHHEKQGE